jgi:hypothetical protein
MLAVSISLLVLDLRRFLYPPIMFKVRQLWNTLVEIIYIHA